MNNVSKASARPPLTALAVVVAVTMTLLSGLATSVAALDGPAPVPATQTVIADVHTDAIATFWDEGQLVLATKADTPALGTRYEADEVWFHVDDDSRVSWPTGAPSFVAPEGSAVWLAPQSEEPNQIWPGFSTESVPLGTLDGDETALTLVGVDGPGDVEVWQTDTFGVPTRLWSSDEDITSFTRGRVHMHANWAFTQPGTYELTVQAAATVAGNPVADTAVYTFVVGELPEPVPTTTSLAASDTDLTLGDPVTLTAAVSPAGVDGAVEFRDGANVLGHDPVDGTGAAELVVSNLGLGPRTITAAFVPSSTNLATASTSLPVAITVTDGSGVPFGIAGVEPSYEPGDTLNATAVGVTLEPDQRLRWLWRVAGSADYNTGDPADTFSRELSASDDGYELGVSVWRCGEWDEYCNTHDSAMVAQSAWVPVNVSGLGQPIVAELTSSPSAFYGDVATIAVSGRELAEGEHIDLVRRVPSSDFPEWSNDELIHVDGDTVSIYLQQGGEFAVRVVNEDGLAIAQSDPVAIEVEQYEVQIAGVQGLYRPGATVNAQAIVHPERPDLHYEWAYFVPGGMGYFTVEQGTGAEAMTTEIPDLTLEHNAGVFFLSVSVPIGPPFVEEPGLAGAGQTNVRVYVREIAPGEQVFQFQPLADHYHQGNPVNLVLGVDPPPAEGDQVVWEWKWPGTEWAPFPGASGLSHQLIAEQALDGVQVRATLDFAGEEAASVVAGPVTVFHDDHGAPPRQQPTVGGPLDYLEGEDLALTRSLPTNGQTVLTDHRWERRAAGSPTWLVLEGQTGADLSVPTTSADDGASYRVSILKPNGDVAYGPSPAVTLSVEPGTQVPARPVVLDEGHIDLFELTWDGDAAELALAVKDDTELYDVGVRYREPEDVTIDVDESIAGIQIPEGLPPSYDFLGAAGDPIYLLDETQQPGLPWPGWSSERLNDTLPDGVQVPYEQGAVTFAVDVTGPGDVFTFQNGGFGDAINRYIDTADPAPDVIETTASAHTHTAWAFTAPGDYLLTVTPAATTTDGATLSGPSHTYHIHVGPPLLTPAEPPALQVEADPAVGLAGETVTLTATQSPDTGLTDVRWYRWDDGYTQIGAGNETTMIRPATPTLVRVTLHDETGRLVTSAVSYVGPLPRIVPGEGSVVEGSSATTELVVPVNLEYPVAAPVTVQWTTLPGGPSAGRAEPGSDYLATSGTVTFEPGVTAKEVTVPVLGDTAVEGSEYLVVSFHTPTNASMGGFWGLGFGTIIEDDVPVVIPGSVAGFEGSSGTVALEVPVTLSAPSSVPVTVAWTTLDAGPSGTRAQPGVDYLASSGTVTFAPGETEKTVTVLVNGDVDPEGDELVVVSFHGPTNAVMGGYWGLGLASILNDDF